MKYGPHVETAYRLTLERISDKNFEDDKVRRILTPAELDAIGAVLNDLVVAMQWDPDTDERGSRIYGAWTAMNSAWAEIYRERKFRERK